MLFAVAAAVLFGVGGRPALVAGAVLLYLGFVLDCVDGQLARYTRHFSAWGGWLDTMADRAKEYLVYAGLGYGASHAGFRYGWALAIAAMTLQTVRHMTDTWYGVLHDEAARRPKAAGATRRDRRQAERRVDPGAGGHRFAVVLAEADRGLPDRGAVGADRAGRGAVQPAGQPGRGAGLGCAGVRVHRGVADAAGPLDAGAGAGHGRRHLAPRRRAAGRAGCRRSARWVR